MTIRDLHVDRFGTATRKVIVIERSPESWVYRDEGCFLMATKAGPLVTIGVGFDGIAEEPSYAIDLPGPVLASFIDWIKA